MIRLLAALLIPAAVSWAESVTRIQFTRSGGIAGAAAVTGTVDLSSKAPCVTAANGYRRELAAEEVKTLREAIAKPQPVPSRGADAYQYAIRVERPGRRARTLTLTDTSEHPLVPWLQKEAGAIARHGRTP